VLCFYALALDPQGGAEIAALTLTETCLMTPRSSASVSIPPTRQSQKCARSCQSSGFFSIWMRLLVDFMAHLSEAAAGQLPRLRRFWVVVDLILWILAKTISICGIRSMTLFLRS
jgi:hypothetical protein